jgi:hypothetical protein
MSLKRCGFVLMEVLRPLSAGRLDGRGFVLVAGESSTLAGQEAIPFTPAHTQLIEGKSDKEV